MKYYIDTVEQIYGEKEGTYTEYGKREKKEDEQSALTAYYKKLSDVSAALDKTHVYMNIKITRSDDFNVKGDTLGTYIEDVQMPDQTPTEEPAEE